MRHIRYAMTPALQSKNLVFEVCDLLFFGLDLWRLCRKLSKPVTHKVLDL